MIIDVSSTETITALGHTGNGGWHQIASWDSLVTNPTGCNSDNEGVQLINNAYNAKLAAYGITFGVAFTGSATIPVGSPYNNYTATFDNGKYFATFAGNVVHRADGKKWSTTNTKYWVAANNGWISQRTCSRCGSLY